MYGHLNFKLESILRFAEVINEVRGFVIFFSWVIIFALCSTQ